MTDPTANDTPAPKIRLIRLLRNLTGQNIAELVPVADQILAITGDPAPPGLNAAQEIRSRLTECLHYVPTDPTELGQVLATLNHLAAWVDHGTDTVACPDP